MTQSSVEESLWDDYEYNKDKSEALSLKHRSYASDVWFRFRHKPASLTGLIIILIVILFAVFGPFLTNHSYEKQELSFVNIPPSLNIYEMGDDYIYISKNLKPIHVAKNGYLIKSLPRIKEDLSKKRTSYDFDGQTIYVDYSEKPIRLIDSSSNAISSTRKIHNRTYLLGSDKLGRDLLTRLMIGARISLLVAFVAALTNLVIGILYGGISAYIGGNTDNIMMRIVDIISTIPLTLYVILIMVVLPGDSGILSIIIALGSVYWVNMARVVRGQILTLKEQDYVHGARIMGTSTWNILTKHLIPNAMGSIIVTVTMLIPSAIFIEAFLSFIGLGVSPPMASWGTMCNDALEALRTNPYQLFTPSLAICITMFGFNFIGDGLRDALDPKLKGR
ncbi:MULTISPECIES: ABC transporter permease [unclassified Oceanispirochaeta]|uniref:ABC transporter permease n=1 Tax=unclassified Oceanispirochaeta TaxID=2635722 RepID=UPI000E08FF45|nr:MULTISPECIES: ABC transporter permease [unclassified Oceanispirochaeta]MBF9014161.1 ABC transporter permease [Oceanispirochaeta sp. M2]NPD70651.1 ABC transporter permease [Oceanispirochaeta sp. M1]RDG34413.1 ABC transporter permease [Oceanispirochaeta sp. M1]